MNYLDFDIEIGKGQGREYPVAVSSPGGEARGTMHFPYGELQLGNRLKDLKIALLRSGGKHRLSLSQEEQTVQTFGQDLFKALLTGELLSLYRVSRREAEQQGLGLRVRLRIQAPDLAALPWEFLYDPHDDYLCLSQQTPLVRYLELPSPPRPLRITLPLRILAMVSSPTDLPELDTAQEKERMTRALARLEADGLVQLTWLSGATWRDLQTALRPNQFHIFHFIGHGGFDTRRDEGLISFCDDQGKARDFQATELARLLADYHSLRLVVLNACEGARGSGQDVFSSTAAILVKRRLPAVLAMQYAITDRAAIELARSFYEALAAGLPVDTAVSEARKGISYEVRNTVEWGTPVLFMRAPDGHLFEMVAAPTPAAASKPTAKLVDQPARQHEPQPDYGEPEWVEIPAGKFWLGSEKGHDDEKPVQQVYLDTYHIGKTPVTNAQYQLFVAATGQAAPSHWQNGAVPKELAHHPVVNVNWHDALAYCRWLSEVTRKPITLPSEAEWEKAARGDKDKREYPWGDTFDPKRANTGEGGLGKTTAVGSYPQGASPYGVLDMSGNVWEWTRSEYKFYHYLADDGRENLENTDATRVVRGGSWLNDQDFARAACRYGYRPVHRSDRVGFRVALVRRPPSHQDH